MSDEYDFGYLARLAGAIGGALNQAGADHAGSSGKAMPDAYSRFRSAIADSLPDGLRDEFADLFPDRGWTVRNDDVFAVASAHNEAANLLAQMQGWLRAAFELVRLVLERGEKPPGQYL